MKDVVRHKQDEEYERRPGDDYCQSVQSFARSLFTICRACVILRQEAGTKAAAGRVEVVVSGYTNSSLTLTEPAKHFIIDC